jgi:hypothetical protein
MTVAFGSPHPALGWPLPEGLPAMAIVADIEIARVAAPIPNKALRSMESSLPLPPTGGSSTGAKLRLGGGTSPRAERIDWGSRARSNSSPSPSTIRVWTTLPRGRAAVFDTS